MKKKLVKSQLCNINTYNLYKREMLTLASNVFEFENLPDYIDLAYLNKTLLKNGSIAFFKDEVLGVIALPYTIIGTLDIYGRPNRIQVYSYTGSYTRALNKDEYVIMYDNSGCYPIYLDICQMAERIALCKRTIDVNIVQQRTPRIWYTSQDKVESVKELLNEVDGLCENVIGYESLDVEGLDKVLAPAPYVADKIDDHLEKEWQEFYRLIGIASVTIAKKERLIKDEMLASQGGTIASRYSRFEPRKKAVKLINEKFGTDIKVRYYDGVPSEPKKESEDDVNVSLYDDAVIS